MKTKWNIDTARLMPFHPIKACKNCGRSETLRIIALRKDEHNTNYVRSILCIACGYKPHVYGISDEMVIQEWNDRV